VDHIRQKKQVSLLNKKLLKLVAIGCLVSASLFAIGGNTNAKPRAIDIRLRMTAEIQVKGEQPCMATLFGPASKNCLQVQPNVDASAILDPLRQRIFASAGDNFLHVLDSENKKPIAQIKTEGRVVTDPLFIDELAILYIGTDKGIIYALDLFSFANIFTFRADSKINNDLIMVGGMLIFTSGMGTIYSIDRSNGTLRWEIKRPLAAQRLRQTHNSNIVSFTAKEQEKKLRLVIPHADGYLSVVNAATGQLDTKISLGSLDLTAFPDIVAPMVWLKKRLWVASYGHGIFGIDIFSGKIREKLDVKGIVQLASDDSKLFAASSDALLAISETVQIIWKNNLAEIKSRVPHAGFPFHWLKLGAKRLFYGGLSKLLLTHGNVILATSAGSIGIFNKMTGQLEQIAANSVGLGPKINWAGPALILAVSKRGLLMEFEIFNPQSIIR
jgi:outer membrane protein assembly factor BamB